MIPRNTKAKRDATSKPRASGDDPLPGLRRAYITIVNPARAGMIHICLPHSIPWIM